MYLPIKPSHSPTLRLFLILPLLPLYLAAYHYRLEYPSTSPTPSLRPTPAEWLRTWLAHPLLPNESFNPSAIARYCNATTWHPNLVFRLDNANGGIGNVRGNILDFVFFAIEAGAAIVLPGWARRGEDIGDVWGGEGRGQFGDWFDEEWFLRGMEKACPQMDVYKPQPNQSMAEAINGAKGNFLPRSRRMDESFEYDRKSWLANLDVWLKETNNFKADELMLVNLERTLWDIDTRSLPPGFRRNFGMLVKVKDEVKRLAGVIVREMSERFQLDVDPVESIPNARGRFYGAHLRTERDALNAGWLDEAVGGNFSAQTDAYIQQAVKAKLNVMYVASGNVTELYHFAQKALTHRPPVMVVSKFDVLPAVERETLKTMSWDQQALVDYEVLQRCSVFSGFVKSSFSYNIGMTRNQWLEDHGVVVVDPWMVQHSEFGVSFDDGMSRMVGRDAWHEKRIPRGMWP